MKWHPSGITRTWIPRETAPATKSEEKRMFSQVTRIGEVKTSIDNTTGQRSLFLDSSIFFFNSTRIFFDSNFKISTRVFFSFVNIYFANLDSYFLLHSMYFTSFDLRIMFSTCFYYRYSFVRNGTPYIWLRVQDRVRLRLWNFERVVSTKLSIFHTANQDIELRKIKGTFGWFCDML